MDDGASLPRMAMLMCFGVAIRIFSVLNMLNGETESSYIYLARESFPRRGSTNPVYIDCGPVINASLIEY